MAAPKGNNFWERRSKHGRDKIFKTPEILWEAACEYFIDTLENPLTEIDYVGKDANPVTRKYIPPFTIHGLCIFLDVNTAYFRHFKSSIEGKTDQLSKDFSTVIIRIEDVMSKQKFDGATVGLYNANIIARDLGLIDKQEKQIEGSLGIVWHEQKTYDNSETK